MSVNADFDWSADAEDVVVPEQDPIAIYRNPSGVVVISQKVDYTGAVYVVVQPSNALALCRAILRNARLDEAIEKVAPSPKDRTAAERSRRQRKRSEARDAPRNGSQLQLLSSGE